MHGIISAVMQNPDEREQCLDREDELNALKEYIGIFEKEFGCRV